MPERDVTPIIVAVGVVGIGVATWFRLPGLPVLWVALIVAAWMIQAPPLTGKKDSNGYPAPANSAEERKLSTYRSAKALQSSLILPIQDMIPSWPVEVAWLAGLWAAAVGYLFPVIGSKSVPQSTGRIADAVVAFIMMVAICGARRRSLGSDNPGVRLDTFRDTFDQHPFGMIFGSIFGFGLGFGAGVAVTLVTYHYGSGFGQPLAHSYVHPGIPMWHPLVLWLLFGIGGAFALVGPLWKQVALVDWRVITDAREQWKSRWESLKYDIPPVLVDRQVTDYGSSSGPAQVVVDTCEAPAHLGAIEFMKLEKRLDPMVGAGMKVAVLSSMDTDGENPIPGTWSGTRFQIVVWPAMSPPELSAPGVVLDDGPRRKSKEVETQDAADCRLASLWIRSSLAWVAHGMGVFPEPASVSTENVYGGGAESDDLIDKLEQAGSSSKSAHVASLRPSAMKSALSALWSAVKVAPGGPEGTLAAALREEQGAGYEYEGPPISPREIPGPPGDEIAAPADEPSYVWKTDWVYPVNLGAKYLRENSTDALASTALATTVIDHRNGTIYFGISDNADNVDPSYRVVVSNLMLEDYWRAVWTHTLKQGANIPKVQPKTVAEAQLVNRSAVHRTAFAVNEGNNPREYKGVEENLASALKGAKFVAITGWYDANQGGRPGDRHPQALCVYWSNDPVPMTPKWLVPSPSPANRWVLSGIVNQVFATIKLPPPEVVEIRPLTNPQAPGHAWEVALRLYGNVTTGQLRGQGQRIAESLAVPWVRVTDSDDGCLLYFGEVLADDDLANPADRDRITSLDWEQAFLSSGVVGSTGRVPVLVATDHMPANQAVEILDFLLPPGLSVSMVRTATPKLRTSTGNAYVEVLDSPNGPTQVRIRASKENPLPDSVPFDFEVADRVEGYAFATGVDGEPVSFVPTRAVHAAIIGGTGSGKSTTARSVLYGAAIKGSDIYIVDPSKSAADFQFIRPYAKGIFITVADSAAALKAIYHQVEQRRDVNAKYGVGSYLELPDEIRPPPITLMIDEFTSLITADKVERREIDDPELEAERLAQLADANDRRTIGAFTGKLARESRSAGVTVLLGTQKLMAASMEGIAGGGDLKANLSRILLGSTSPGDRMSALRSFDSAPDIGSPIPIGRGIWESIESVGQVIQGWYATSDRFTEEMAKRLKPLAPEELMDLTPYRNRRADTGMAVLDPDGVEDVVLVGVEQAAPLDEIDLGELEFSLDDLTDGPDEDELASEEPAPVPEPAAGGWELDWGSEIDASPLAPQMDASPVPAAGPVDSTVEDDPFADPPPARRPVATEPSARAVVTVPQDDDPFA